MCSRPLLSPQQPADSQPRCSYLQHNPRPSDVVHSSSWSEMRCRLSLCRPAKPCISADIHCTLEFKPVTNVDVSYDVAFSQPGVSLMFLFNCHVLLNAAIRPQSIHIFACFITSACCASAAGGIVEISAAQCNVLTPSIQP